ncbi:hypothetical protein ACWDAO_39360 [Streptomyces sp. NPDC001212]
MPKPYDTNFEIEPPADLPLSPKVKSLRKVYQDAEAAHEKYIQENSRYRTINVAPVWSSTRQDGSLALEDAKRELREAEIAAVGAKKPLPDKDEFLAPVKNKMDEYDRTVSALKVLAQKAKQEYSHALHGELKAMGLRQAEKAAKARDEWEQAYRAMVAARETMLRHVGLFTFCVSAGDADFHPRHGHSQGERLEVWQLTKDGMLTFEASQELEYPGYLIKVEGLIEPNPNPPEPVKEVEFKMPPQHHSKPAWDENVSYVGEIY